MLSFTGRGHICITIGSLFPEMTHGTVILCCPSYHQLSKEHHRDYHRSSTRDPRRVLIFNISIENTHSQTMCTYMAKNSQHTWVWNFIPCENIHGNSSKKIPTEAEHEATRFQVTGSLSVCGEADPLHNFTLISTIKLISCDTFSNSLREEGGVECQDDHPSFLSAVTVPEICQH